MNATPIVKVLLFGLSMFALGYLVAALFLRLV
ncbi:hypothetical protein GGQ98_002837 [Sphingosinicella soli]|uniref:Uncharacterized protein n=1 Tax=Sphingosinicella soli TaxID=333708 RepID=A0A7W7B379_9SPHN|nr:hypothetical protein [Sphingosinicella soli]